MATPQANQPQSIPIYNQQQAIQLQQGDFSSLNAGAGANGIYRSIGSPAVARVYVTLQSGEPIIANPETGEPYPPGFVPTVQDPNTRENWQVGDSWREQMEITNAKSRESLRLTREILIRPFEEALAGKAAEAKGEFDRAMTKYATGAAGALYGKDNPTLKNIQEREQRYKQIAQQQLQAAKQQPYATPQQPRLGGVFQGTQQSLPPASSGGQGFTLAR